MDISTSLGIAAGVIVMAALILMGGDCGCSSTITPPS
jgi:hypothetical protein